MDITHAVDEMLFYIDSGGDRRALDSLVQADTNLMIYNIHPKNFGQFNRFLKATSVNEPEILYEWQGTLIAFGVKKKACREHPEFQWVTDTAYATDPRFKKDIERISKSS